MHRLVWYAGLYSATAALLKLAGFALFLWLARSLSVEEYAKFGLLYAIQTGVMTFALAGVIESVVGLLKNHEGGKERRGVYAAASIAFMATGAVASGLAFIGFVVFARGPGVQSLSIAWVLASAVLLAFASFQAQIVRLEERHVTSLSFSFVAPMAGVVGGFVGFGVARTVDSFFLGSAIGLMVALLSLWRSREGFHRRSERLIEIRALLLAGSPFVVVAIFGWLSGYGNNYVIHFLFESAEVARFTFALTISSIIQLIATALNQVWSPRFYKLINEETSDNIERKNRRFFRLQSVSLGVVGGVTIAVFPVVIEMIGGNLVEYQSMTRELAFLFAAYIFLSPWWHCQNYYLVHGKGPELMRIVLVTSALGIGLWILLMWVLGPLGIYLGFTTQMLLRTLGVVWVAKRWWPITIAWDGVVIGTLLLLLGTFVSPA